MGIPQTQSIAVKNVQLFEPAELNHIKTQYACFDSLHHEIGINVQPVHVIAQQSGHIFLINHRKSLNYI